MENPVLRQTKFMWRLIGGQGDMIDLKSITFDKSRQPDKYGRRDAASEFHHGAD